MHLITDRNLLKSAAAFHSGFQPPAVVLEGLTEEQATAKPYGLPHSIADLVAHMNYWQEFFSRIATDGFTTFPEQASEGWPGMKPGEWNDLRDRYLAGVDRTQQQALEAETLDRKLLPEDSPLPIWHEESVGSGLLHGVIHSSHHLGQIVTLRQLLNAWPPPAGSMTW